MKRILLVEDDPRVARALTVRLRSAGYDLDMRSFFAAPSIAALAAKLGAGNGDRQAGAPPPSPCERVSLTAGEEAELFPDD